MSTLTARSCDEQVEQSGRGEAAETRPPAERMRLYTAERIDDLKAAMAELKGLSSAPMESHYEDPLEEFDLILMRTVQSWWDLQTSFVTKVRAVNHILSLDAGEPVAKGGAA